jgi:predicted helicase
MLKENLAFITPRQFKEQPGAFATQHIATHKTVSVYDINNVFPVYLYPDADKKDLFSATESHQKKPNLNPGLLTALTKAYGKKPTPEDIFYYVYAVLYADTYRTRYAEFLKTDFPRVPFTKSHKLFIAMGERGKQLVELHLLKAPDLEHPVARFEGKGDNRMEKQRYSENEQRVYIDAAQYFEGISKETWEYQIGGYQVLDKWLKDRKARVLSLEDIQHYCRVATALKKTIEIQEEIDGLFPAVEKEVLPLVLTKK